MAIKGVPVLKTRKGKEVFLERAAVMHGGRYDYSLVEFERFDDKTTIICAKHGEFQQSPEKHCKGRGCPACSKEDSHKRNALTKEEFVGKAIAIHGHKYCYALVDYFNNSVKVSITCKEHGVFSQTPGSHMSGNGCPKCGRKGWFKPCEKSILYILKTDGIVKIGVTNTTVSSRIGNLKYNSGIDFVRVKSYKVGNKALEIEQSLLKYFRKIYSNPNTKFHGSTECFVTDDSGSFIRAIEKVIGENNG